MLKLAPLAVLVALAPSPSRPADPCAMWVDFDGGFLISNRTGECRNPTATCGQISAFDPSTGTTTITCYCGDAPSHTTPCKAWLYTYSNGTFLIDCVNESCAGYCTNPPVLGTAPQRVCDC